MYADVKEGRAEGHRPLYRNWGPRAEVRFDIVMVCQRHQGIQFQAVDLTGFDVESGPGLERRMPTRTADIENFSRRAPMVPPSTTHNQSVTGCSSTNWYKTSVRRFVWI